MFYSLQAFLWSIGSTIGVNLLIELYTTNVSLCSKPDGTREEKPMDASEKVWEILLSAEKKDYERICAEYGITNFRGMLKKLTEMKKEREEEIAQV